MYLRPFAYLTETESLTSELDTEASFVQAYAVLPSISSNNGKGMYVIQGCT